MSHTSPPLSPVEIVEADLSRADHQQAVVELIDAYAADPMGNGQRLPAEVRERLISGLRNHPTTIILLAYRDGKAIGIAVCFHGFSTFNARPLINIHDLGILLEHRGQGVGRRLLEAVEQKARQMNCCKVTLEVQTQNHRARGVYASAGFEQVVHQRAAGGALFLSKNL